MSFISFLKGKRFREITGIIFIMVGILNSVSILSFSNSDPYWGSQITSYDYQINNNYTGILGSTICRYQIKYLGFGTFILTIFIFIFGITQFLAEPERIYLARFVGMFFLFMAMICTLSLILVTTEFKSFKISGGGIFGDLLVNNMIKYLNYFGTWTIIITSYVLGFILSTNLSLSYLIKGIFRIPIIFLKFSKNVFFKKQKNKLNFKSEIQTSNKPKKIKKVKEKVLFKSSKVDSQKVQLTLFNDLKTSYQLPVYKIFNPPKGGRKEENEKENQENAERIVKKLKDFGIEGKIMDYLRGPVVTDSNTNHRQELK